MTKQVFARVSVAPEASDRIITRDKFVLIHGSHFESAKGLLITEILCIECKSKQGGYVIFMGWVQAFLSEERVFPEVLQFLAVFVGRVYDGHEEGSPRLWN